jgi:hypothetical protein
MELSTYIIAPEPISTAQFINPFYYSGFICVSPSLVGNGSAKTLLRQQIRNSRSIVGRIVFYAVYVVSKESRRLVFPKTSCLAYFPSFEKIKISLCHHHTVCVSVYPPYQLSNALKYPGEGTNK